MEFVKIIKKINVFIRSAVVIALISSTAYFVIYQISNWNTFKVRYFFIFDIDNETIRNKFINNTTALSKEEINIVVTETLISFNRWYLTDKCNMLAENIQKLNTDIKIFYPINIKTEDQMIDHIINSFMIEKIPNYAIKEIHLKYKVEYGYLIYAEITPNRLINNKDMLKHLQLFISLKHRCIVWNDLSKFCW